VVQKVGQERREEREKPQRQPWEGGREEMRLWWDRPNCQNLSVRELRHGKRSKEKPFSIGEEKQHKQRLGVNTN
jgi:hypothetical protein